MIPHPSNLRIKIPKIWPVKNKYTEVEGTQEVRMLMRHEITG